MQKYGSELVLAMVMILLAFLSIDVFLTIPQPVHTSARRFAPYRTEFAVAALVSQMPVAVIPSRDRPVIALMREGKRVTSAQINRLGRDIYPYFRARQKAMSVLAQHYYAACHKQALTWLFRIRRRSRPHAS